MKSYLIACIFTGVLILGACKDTQNSQTENTNGQLRELGLTPTSSAESKASSTVTEARKVWPPASDESVSDQTIENYLVVLDDSGSMKGNRIQQAKEALTTLADTLDPKHNLGLIQLNGNKVIQLATSNRREFKNAVAGAVAEGGTPLTKGTKRAYREVTKQASRQQGYGGYHMIIVTDGESGDGSPMKMVRAIVRNTSIQVHVIGFHLNNHEMNNQDYVDYHTANNADELVKAFEAVAAETNEFTDPKEFNR